MNQLYAELSEKMVRIDVMRRTVMCRELYGKELFKGQFPIMRVICENEGCTQKFLADHLMVTPASIALSVKRLEKSGMIRKATDKTNLRCNKIYSTSKGRETMEMVREMNAALEERMFEGFTEEELLETMELIGRISDNLRNYLNIPPDFLPIEGILTKNDEKEEIDSYDKID